MNDDYYEQNETFKIMLDVVDANVFALVDMVIVTIIDDDIAPSKYRVHASHFVTYILHTIHIIILYIIIIMRIYRIVGNIFKLPIIHFKIQSPHAQINNRCMLALCYSVYSYRSCL